MTAGSPPRPRPSPALRERESDPAAAPPLPHGGGGPGWGWAAAAVGAVQTRRLRPERLSGIHNPWGYPIEGVDPWAVLALCEGAALVREVATVLGPDIILWDSELHATASDYRDFVEQGREGRYWPVSPLGGAVALVGPDRTIVRRLDRLRPADLDPADEPLLVVRYMAATSRFVRDPDFPANRLGMEERLLVNYAARPLWLVAGEDRAGNDFTAGFAPPIPQWANAG